MMEARIFAVLKTADGGLKLCLTTLQPTFPAPDVLAVLRLTGAIDGPMEINLPGASLLPED